MEERALEGWLRKGGNGRYSKMENQEGGGEVLQLLSVRIKKIE
jgi:hypothetical protein